MFYVLCVEFANIWKPWQWQTMLSSMNGFHRLWYCHGPHVIHLSEYVFVGLSNDILISVLTFTTIKLPFISSLPAGKSIIVYVAHIVNSLVIECYFPDNSYNMNRTPEVELMEQIHNNPVPNSDVERRSVLVAKSDQLKMFAYCTLCGSHADMISEDIPVSYSKYSKSLKIFQRIIMRVSLRLNGVSVVRNTG